MAGRRILDQAMAPLLGAGDPQDELPSGSVDEYVDALKSSPRLGSQVVYHRILSGREPEFAQPVRPWPRAVENLLAARSIPALYAHQVHATDLIRAGRHVVVATPTASGKTLVYNLPVLERFLHDPDARALYMFPLKALAQDQLKAFNELTSSWPESARPRAAIYDGDVSDYARRKIRENPPHALLTNPEMLHLALLPYHEKWSTFLAGLSFVVVDEVHTYRGVMGSHMAQVFRRLNRVAARFGASPTFIFCSATVANPGELAQSLTGHEVATITESGAPQGKRHFVFLDPLEGAAHAAIMLLKSALARNLRTIVYCQSRKLTELVSLWAQDKAGPYKDRISAYRAGFLPEERREIEARMTSGELLAVISTSALELGIDIGALDLCILVGYPGTIMSTLQRGGRVGRSLKESAVVLVAQEDALDQYFMRHPEDFFERPPESAVLNPYNEVLLARHLDCAAAELPLTEGEPWLQVPEVRQVAAAMEAEGRLLRSKEGDRILSRRKQPHREVDLRGAGASYRIEALPDGKSVGLVDEQRAFRETHKGAVYLHRGKTYLVKELDLGARTVTVTPARVDYYTRVRGSKNTEILEVYDYGKVWGTRIFRGKLRVTEFVTGYEKRKVKGGTLMTIVPLDLPPMVFETEGVWIEIPTSVQRLAEDQFYHFMGGIHALEHAMIGILPLIVMTDRNDLGGISTPMHPQVGLPAVFVYDAAPGGVGLTRLAFAKAEELMERTLDVVASCPCDLGCPSCVHSPKCGSGNRPIDKAAALFLLGALQDAPPPEIGPQYLPQLPDQKEETTIDGVAVTADIPKAQLRYAVLDVETQLSAQEVGGWHKAKDMRVSCCVVYYSDTDEYVAYREDELPAMFDRLQELDLIIGFNILRFDYAVLGPYAGGLDLHSLPTLDMLQEVRRRLGYRLSLDALGAATLDAQKTADGLQALAWWKEGRLDEIIEYCTKDVELTRDLYLHGREHGYLLFTNKAKQTVRLPVEW
ncbi:DEAD/DEAH box helicase [Oceanidesulfovibrio marinus]|nr:DEAD/DEAH box helicase [Oceanidesulfovibrio marinus]